ncbi:MAG: integration host factor [Atopobiaceae bacterium]|jgi:hypothetical protein|nr:integration host factor [Atopobiaceae bacterium]
MSLPNLTIEQRRDALKKAASIRHERAQIKAKIKAHEIGIAEIFALADSGNVAVRHMRTSQLLMCFPGVGKARAEKILQKYGISQSRRIGGLGRAQREQLTERFGHEA